MNNGQEIVIRYQQGQGINKIQREMGISNYRIILRILKENNIDIRRSKNIHDDKIIQLYQQGITSPSKIAEILNIPKANIDYYFSKYNLKSITKRGDLDEDFFENIDTEEKAYCLGLMYSDGCIFEHKDRKGGKLCILKMKDLDVIEKFAKSLKYKGKIKTVISKIKNHNDLYEVRIMSVKLTNDLASKGCVPRKSPIITFPQDIIPENLIRHFIRGVFDGDGSISRREFRRYNVSIVGTKNLMEGIQKRLSCKTNLYKHKNSYAHTLVMSSNLDKKIFLDWIYKNANIYMNRKYHLYKQFDEELRK